jgi:hypothetical protein
MDGKHIVCIIACPGCSATGSVSACSYSTPARPHVSAGTFNRYEVEWTRDGERWFERGLRQSDLDEDFDCGCGTVPASVTKRRVQEEKRERWIDRKRDSANRMNRLRSEQ